MRSDGWLQLRLVVRRHLDIPDDEVDELDDEAFAAAAAEALWLEERQGQVIAMALARVIGRR